MNSVNQSTSSLVSDVVESEIGNWNHDLLIVGAPNHFDFILLLFLFFYWAAVSAF